MKLLTTIRPRDIDPAAPVVDPTNFYHRQAARAVVFDAHGKVGLLHVTKHGYYKLPGGGVEDGEDIEQALQRELLEELGCAAEVRGEIGQIIEHRDYWQMKQTSFCYVAHVVGEKGEPQFTDEEKDDGFEIVWATDGKEALALMASGTHSDPGIMFMQLRDTTLLKQLL